MIVRALALAGGVTGAAGLSQFPEFSQQYMQRLGGTVDELHRQIERYEMDADKVGLTLEELLAELSAEGPRAKTQAGNIQSDIDRHAQLSDALTRLKEAGPFTRARLVGYMSDREIAGKAFDDYKPAVPATFEGAIFAGTGFFAGWAGFSVILAVLGGLWASFAGLFRRRSA